MKRICARSRNDWGPHPWRGGALALLLVLGSGLHAHAQPEDPAAESQRLARQIHEAVQALHAARLEHDAGEREQGAHLDALEAQNRRLAEDMARVQTAGQDAQAGLDQLRADIAGDERAGADAAHTLAALEPALRSLAMSAQARVVAGIHHRREERAAPLQRTLEVPPASPERQAVAFAGLSRWLQEELRLARTTEVRNLPVVAPGDARRVHAFVVRLGLLQRFYVSEDGALVGMEAPGPAEPERWLAVTDAAERDAFRAALAILQKKRAPALLTLTLPVAPAHPATADASPLLRPPASGRRPAEAD